MLIGEKSVVNCWSIIISLGYCGLWELEERSLLVKAGCLLLLASLYFYENKHCCLSWVLFKCRNSRFGHLVQWSCCHLYTGTSLLQTANLSGALHFIILYILLWMNLNKEEINLKVTLGGWFLALKWASHNFSVSMMNFDEPEVAVLHSARGAQLIFVCCLEDLQSLGAVRDELLPIYTWGCIWIQWNSCPVVTN